MAQIKWHGKIHRVRHVLSYPSRFKLGDLIAGPGGNLLEVVTVQRDVPIWESNYRTKTAIVFKTEAGDLVPVDDLKGEFDVYRM